MTTSLAVMILLIAVGAAAFLLGRASGGGRSDDLTDMFSRPPGRARADLPQDDAELQLQVRALLADGNKIEAIKLVRETTGVDLKDAKDFVEGL